MPQIKMGLALILLLLLDCQQVLAKDYVFASSEFAGIAEYNEAGQPTGIGVDIVNRIANELNITIEIKLYPFNRMMSHAKDKSIDAIFGVYKKPHREQFLDYVDISFFNDSYLFFKRKGTTLDWTGNMAEFPKNSRFCWVMGWSYFDELFQIKKQIRLEKNSTLAGCLNMLVATRFDLIAGPIRDIIPLIKKQNVGNKVQLVAKDKGIEGNYIAFPKGHLPKLQQEFKQSLSKTMASSWYQEKLRQYDLENY